MRTVVLTLSSCLSLSLSLSPLLFFFIFFVGSRPLSVNSVGSLIKSSPSPPASFLSLSLMAEVPGDAEFWLPSEFLPDEDLFMEKVGSVQGAAFSPFSLNFPNEFPIEFDSVINSPVESTASSSETESTDEEFLAALNRRLAQSVLYEPVKPAAPFFTQNENEKKNWFVSGSPQSTLTGIGRFSGTGKVSCNGSPNGPLQFPSPPETSFETEKDTWNIIYAAAGEVARIQTAFDSSKHSFNHFPTSRAHLPCRKIPSPVSFFGHNLFQSPPQTAQFHGRFFDQVLKDECSVLHHPRQRLAASERASACHPWPTQSQTQQPLFKSSSFQASFNGGSCAKRESVGTGVFLPRHYQNLPEPRKQTALPTVRPLKFHGDALSYKDSKERSRAPINVRSGRDYNSPTAPRYELSGQQKPAYGGDAAQRKELLHLPREWTY